MKHIAKISVNLDFLEVISFNEKTATRTLTGLEDMTQMQQSIELLGENPSFEELNMLQGAERLTPYRIIHPKQEFSLVVYMTRAGNRLESYFPNSD